jgi:hypothetical protein
MEVVGKLPYVFSKETNLSLEEEVMEPELRASLFSMKNEKNLSQTVPWWNYLKPSTTY